MGKPRKATEKNDGPAKKVRRIVCDLPIPEISKLAGTLLACGQGDMGQLGLGVDDMEKKRPTIVGSLKNIVSICAGGMHSLALAKDGVIYSFGCNDEGALGRDSSEFTPDKIDLPGKCVRISAGDSHSACLLEDGRTFAWGSFRDSHGNMGLTLEGNKRLPIEILPGIKSCDIASGADHLVILTCAGKIYTMGCGEQGQLGRVSLRTASGESRRGKTEILNPGVVTVKRTSYIDAIWATTYGTFARDMNTSKIVAFGLNNYNQLGMKKTSEPIIAPSITAFEDVLTIAGGQHHTIVLKQDYNCYAVGRKEYGRLGLGAVGKDVEELIQIKEFNDQKVTEISCGDAQSFAITNDGKMYAWGMGSNQQLGTGNEEDEWKPVLISSKQTQDKKILKVSSGGQHSLFIVENELTYVTPKAAVLKNGVAKKKIDDQGTNTTDKNEAESLKLDDYNIENNKEKDIPKVNGLDKDIQMEEVSTSKKPGRKRKN